jgi:hypothetical protein
MTKFDGLRRLAAGSAGACLIVNLAACGESALERSQERTDLPAIAPLLGLESRGAALTSDEREQVLSLLRLRRVDLSTARFTADDMLMAEGDMLFDARELLSEAQGDTEKGYFWKNTGTVTKYRDIHVAGDPSFPPNATWTWAVVTGGGDWNAHTRVAMTTAAPAAGSAVLKVQYFDFAIAGAQYLCFSAFTTAPSGGQPGVIAINSTFHFGPGGCTNSNLPAACRVSSPDNFTWDQKVHITTHELGHALGFGHPADPSAPGVDRIPGTNSATNPDNPTYPSTMWGGAQGCYPGSANVTLGLSSDDIASSNVKYP